MTDFALRIFITDHYLSKPIENVDHIQNDFTKRTISSVPIIRVFGSTPKGQKVCAHIHGVYPYFYVPFFEDISIVSNQTMLDMFLFRFASSLSAAIQLSIASYSKSDISHVFRVVLVQGKPFYGYQEHFQYFLKIYLYNPFHIKKAGDLLLNGAVMDTPIQPYETHIPYNLKFFIDYNLYGMNYLYTDAAMFRVDKNYQPEGSFIDLDVSDAMDVSQKTWNVDQLPPDCIMDDRACSKSSHCELEVDICACDILNIQEVQKNIGQNPGLKDLWEEEKQRRIELGLDLSDLVGEVFEERPMARPADSERELLGQWREVCGRVKNDDPVTSQDIEAFICASPSVEDLNESVNEESIRNTQRTGDSFVTEIIESNKDVDWEDDRELCNFINACIKLEEEDSIIPERHPVDTNDTRPATSHGAPMNTHSESDEDLFNQTMIDLSLAESSDEAESVVLRREKADQHSDDLFDDVSLDIDSDTAEVDLIKSYDGADDDESDVDLVLRANKRLKLDTMAAALIRSPIVTRSAQNNEKGLQIHLFGDLKEKRSRKKLEPRKKRLSLKLKKDYPSGTSSVQDVSSGTSWAIEKSGCPTCFVDLTDCALGVSREHGGNVSKTGDIFVSDIQTPTRKGLTSNRNMFSTPLRSQFAPPVKQFQDISPIFKPSPKDAKRPRTVSFSIPAVSQEQSNGSPRKSQAQPSNADDKLNVLEYMKKSLSQGLHEMSINPGYCLSQEFLASMMSHLTVMSVEVFCNSKSNLQPNPTLDPVLMFFYAIHHETDLQTGSSSDQRVYEEGVVFIDNDDMLVDIDSYRSQSYRTVPVNSEVELLDEIIKLVLKFDPDLLLGYETTRASWGYVLERSFHIKHNLYHSLGRICHDDQRTFKSKTNDKVCSFDELHCVGRVILNLWVVLKHELTMSSYTLENAVDVVLKERVPFFTNQQLMVWHRSKPQRHKVVKYWQYRVSANLKLLSKTDVISRASEFAKIYGIEFFHVLSRGSQYRVESMMLRLAKPQNLIALSPSVQQRSRQKATECIPLTLEPQSGFYTDPVVVLDFQSLYPSVMIAHNYCFSTCLGKLSHMKEVEVGESFEFGCGTLNVEEKTMKAVGDEVNISPNEVVFVRPHSQKGIISKMVEEILTTRIMVKKSMKIHRDNSALCKQLDLRQLGLKLITNVTFGYTAACYSGRMPCVEVGDSILRKSRETLEDAIALVNSGGPLGFAQTDAEGGWAGCKVIYGDTDSTFVLMPGRTKDEAFTLGARIADAVTARNPFPVKLKFEKVFLPCILESKKRYVGHSYETPDQVQPKFDAKGIETVRRDNCNIVSRILEATLTRIFALDDMNSIKKFVTTELDKVLTGKVNMIDFIIAKEYRGRQTYRAGATIPALHIANALRKKDPRAEPLAGQRVPYVIIQGAPGDTLISCVRQPCDILYNTKLIKSYCNNIRTLSEQGCQLSYLYYVTKQILPPLNRALSLLGVDVFKWYEQMPRRGGPTSDYRGRRPPTNINRTISSYFRSQKCLLCNKAVTHGASVGAMALSAVLCNLCLGQGSASIKEHCSSKLRDIEDVRRSSLAQCHTCCGTSMDTTAGVGPPCVSTDCPSLFDRIRSCQQPTEELDRLLASKFL